MNKPIIFLVSIYQATLSKILNSLFGGGCRFTPTCSEYSKQALEKYGVFKGSKLSVIRLMKCHPFSKNYGWDPVQ